MKFMFVVTFYSTDKIWRGDVLAPDYSSVLKYLGKKVGNLADVEKVIVREYKDYDGRHLFGFCPDCGKLLESGIEEG
jgi:hypothetical protein